jgi:hypothetical protein
MKIRPVGAKSFHADGQRQTDITKIIVAFRNFANALKKHFIDEITVSTSYPLQQSYEPSVPQNIPRSHFVTVL